MFAHSDGIDASTVNPGEYNETTFVGLDIAIHEEQQSERSVVPVFN
jgi:hypothetical protein